MGSTDTDGRTPMMVVPLDVELPSNARYGDDVTFYRRHDSDPVERLVGLSEFGIDGRALFSRRLEVFERDRRFA